jgi:hypothetical protein
VDAGPVPFNPALSGTGLGGTGGIDVVQVSCGEKHTCVVTSEGEVICFGIGSHGQLGYGDDIILKSESAEYVPLKWVDGTAEPTVAPTPHPTGPELVLHMRLCMQTVPDFPTLGEFERTAVMRHFQDLIEDTMQNVSVLEQTGLRNPEPILVHWDDQPVYEIPTCALEQVTFLLELEGTDADISSESNFTKYEISIARTLDAQLAPAQRVEPWQVEIKKTGSRRLVGSPLKLSVVIKTFKLGEASKIESHMTQQLEVSATWLLRGIKASTRIVGAPGACVVCVSVPDLIISGGSSTSSPTGTPTTSPTLEDGTSITPAPTGIPTLGPTAAAGGEGITIPAGCSPAGKDAPAPVSGSFSIDGSTYFPVNIGDIAPAPGIFCPTGSGPSGRSRSLRTDSTDSRHLGSGKFNTPCLLVQVRRSASLSEVAKRALEPKIRPCLIYETEAFNQSIRMTITTAKWYDDDSWFTAYPTSAPTSVPTAAVEPFKLPQLWLVAVVVFFLGICLGISSVCCGGKFCGGGGGGGGGGGSGGGKRTPGGPSGKPLPGPIGFKQKYTRVANAPPTSQDVGKPVKVEEKSMPKHLKPLAGNCYDIVEVKGQKVKLNVSKTEGRWVGRWVEFKHLSWIEWEQEPFDDSEDGLYFMYRHVASTASVPIDPKDAMLVLETQFRENVPGQAKGAYLSAFGNDRGQDGGQGIFKEVRIGDLLTHVDGEDVRRMSLKEIEDRIVAMTNKKGAISTRSFAFIRSSVGGKNGPGDKEVAKNGSASKVGSSKNGHAHNGLADGTSKHGLGEFDFDDDGQINPLHSTASRDRGGSGGGRKSRKNSLDEETESDEETELDEKDEEGEDEGGVRGQRGGPQGGPQGSLSKSVWQSTIEMKSKGDAASSNTASLDPAWNSDSLNSSPQGFLRRMKSGASMKSEAPLGAVREDDEESEDEEGSSTSSASRRSEAKQEESEDEDYTPPPEPRVRGISRGASKLMRVRGGTAERVEMTSSRKPSGPQAEGMEVVLRTQERAEQARREEARREEARREEASATNLTLAKEANAHRTAGGSRPMEPVEPRKPKQQEYDSDEYDSDGGAKGTFEI